MNYHIRDFLGSVLLLLYPTQRHALFSIVVTSLSPRRQHVKKITSRSCRQSCLYSDKSSRCFELVEKNFPRISPVSACLANEVLLLFVPDHLLKDVCIMNSLERQRQGLPLQERTGMFTVQLIKIMSLCKTKRRQACCPLAQIQAPKLLTGAFLFFIGRYHLTLHIHPMGIGAWRTCA